MLLKIKIWFLIWWLKAFYQFGRVPTHVIYAQSVLETGGFDSPIFKENNNLFGMKLPRKRKSHATGENRGHATYKNIKNSIRDYFLRQQNFGINNTSDVALYVNQTINSGYAEDLEYRMKWSYLIKKYSKYNWSSNTFFLAGVFFWEF